MSYDLLVYAGRAVEPDELRKVVASAGLEVETESGGTWTLVRGARRTYTATLEAPKPIEPEDVPEEVTAAMLSPRYLYQVVVEGSAEASIPHAVRVARRTAQASDGAVLDQQTGQTWSRGRLRAAPRVESGTVDIVELRWYVRDGFDGAEHARAWTRQAKRWFPEALPRRYGLVEPLQEKYAASGGDEALAGYVSTAAKTGSMVDTMAFFKASQPAVAGHLGTGRRPGIASHGLTLLREPLGDVRWRDALRQFFLAFAVETDSILATAEVQRGLRWSGRSIGYDARSETGTYLAGRDGWVGLPPEPVWWTWFGREYAPLVAEHLTPSSTASVDQGLFHWRAGAPVDREELVAGLPSARGAGLARLFRFGERTGQPWLPARFLPVVDRSNPHVHTPPLTPAAERPEALM